MSPFTYLLTESIDWLIQVRYGNGKDGHGLGELAKALKKLIEEAIEKATTSFDDRQKQLECSVKSSTKSSGKSHCDDLEDQIKKAKDSNDPKLSKLESDLQKHKDADHYMTKEDRERELKDINQKRIDLGDLAVKLGSFIGGGGKVNEAIINAITVLRKQLEMCQKSNNNHTSDDCQNASNCQSITQQIEKLESLKIAINGKQNTPNELLNNLCSGLEAFLGFDPKSKGYNGTGIVYSDLDRLCDGVMGFLSGVLEAVKDDENVKHYYSVDKMTETLTKIKSSMHKSGGLSAAVEAVSTALREWDEKLTSKINNVNNAFQKLKLNAFDDVNNSLSALKNLKTGQLGMLPTMLEHCIRQAGNLTQAFRKAEKHYNELDSNLRNKLKDAVLRVELEIQQFAAAASNDELKSVAETSTAGLEELRKNVNNIAQVIVQQMAKNIDMHIDANIRKPIELIKRGLEKYGGELQEWIKNATLVVDHGIKRCDEICFVLNGEDRTGKGGKKNEEKTAVMTAATKLKQRADVLYGLAKMAKQQVRALVRQALAEVKTMDDALRKNLRTVRDGIVSALKVQIKEKFNAINGLDQKVRNGLGDLEQNIVTKLKAHVKNVLNAIEAELNAIKGTETLAVESSAGLSQVDRKVQKYVAAFNKSNSPGFEGIVGKWIDDILQTNNLVSERLNRYINDNNKWKQTVKSTNPQSMHKPIGEKIKKHLISVIQEAVNVITFGNTKNIDENIAVVKRGVDSFVSGIEKEITQDKLKRSDNVIDKIVGDIETDVVEQANKGYTYENYYLKWAVEIILGSLYATSRQAAKELGSFIGMDDIPPINIVSNIKNALNKAVTLSSYITAAKSVGKGSSVLPSEKVELANYNVDKDVEAEVEEHIPGEKGNISFKNGLMNEFGRDHETLHTALNTQFDADVGRILTEQVGNDATVGNLHITYGQQEDKVALNAMQFKNYLVSVTATAAGKAELKGSKGEGTLPEKVKDIENKINGAGNLQNVSEDLTGGESETFYGDTFEKLLSSFTADFCTFTTAVKDLVYSSSFIQNDDKRGVKTLLNDLRTTLKHGSFVDGGNGLTEIKRRIHHLQNSTITRLATDVANFYNHIMQNQAHEAIEHIKASVSVEADRITRAIQGKVKEEYYRKIQPMFAAMTNNAEKQINGVEAIINYDVRKGVKGLLREMHKERGIQLEEISKHTSSRTDDGLKNMSDAIRNYVDDILFYLKFQVVPTPPDKQGTTVSNIKNQTYELLAHLGRELGDRKYIYDNQFTQLLSHLSTSLSLLRPSAFANPRHPELLDAVRQGLQGFVEQMGKVYVNGYDDGNKIDWDKYVVFVGHNVTPYSDTYIYNVTPDGTKLAKIFCTILNFIYEDFIRLKNKCDDDWKTNKLCLNNREKDNPLGLFLQRCGYTVAKSDTSKDGETQCRKDITGEQVLQKLKQQSITSAITTHLMTCESNGMNEDGETIKKLTVDIFDLLGCILYHIDRYNEVCHYSTHFARRQPCSAYEMLIWLSGLPYSVAHHSLLHDGIGNLLDNPNKKALADVDGISLLDHESSYMDANPRKITWYGITEALEILCSTSYDVLVSIAGTGDADTIYGSDLCNNSFKFKYPPSGEDCLDMLLDILRRLFPPLRFLQTQCSVGASHNGWLQCSYGRDVQPARWPCKEHPTDKSKCQPNFQVNTQANCQPKSPLMSFLSDCHVGCLPHQLTSIGCKYDCKTCPSNKPGMPCLTPLGFRGFSGSMKTGKDLCNVLAKFFGNPYLASFLCLAPKAPSTLPEHFAFTLSLVTGWNNHSRYDDRTLKNSIDNSIKGVSIDLYKNASQLTNAVSNAYSHCTADNRKCEDSHLMDLTSSSTCNKDQYSAPYLKSLSADSYLYLANKHSNAYLSWVLYLPWNFHKYLESLLAAFKDIFCNDWGCRSCLNGKCKKGEHGVLDNTCQCASMVKCSGVMPTLYRYGFAFQDAPTLDARKSAMKCFEFQTVLYKVTRSNYFAKLFDECDMFLWRIRSPFSYLVLALWLLSLLYLLHIMVIRLDLLHIKSHLHSPSSHRIAAQSLLAAARVNKLNRVFYLQP